MNKSVFNTSSVYDYNWLELQYYKDDFDLVFLAEEKIIENSERYILSLKQELKSKLERDDVLNHTSTTEEEEADVAQYYSHYYGSFESLIEQIESNQRKAFILSIFSYIEAHLTVLCDVIQTNFNYNIKLEDLNGTDDIDRCLKYFIKVYGISESKLESKATYIKQQKFIRNKIAHQDSIVDKTKKQQIIQTPGLELRNYGAKYKIIISSDRYVEKLLSKRRELFEALVQCIDERFGELEKEG